MEDNTEKGKFIIKIDCREHDLIPLIKSKFEDSKTIQIETGSLPVGDILFLKDEKEILIIERKKPQTLLRVLRTGDIKNNLFDWMEMNYLIIILCI